ncbi:hypothetical protein E2C01_053864 [Portunus trituberculatus]|uniref:Uncharacterized protein n=1 Tax=Portunus trituberculatus TaxID=210409 RepID=A0A5B7GQH5_PORTR|nr:hypothetical protein [Portunus trituberculatus]
MWRGIEPILKHDLNSFGRAGRHSLTPDGRLMDWPLLPPQAPPFVLLTVLWDTKREEWSSEKSEERGDKVRSGEGHTTTTTTRTTTTTTTTTTREGGSGLFRRCFLFCCRQ